MINRKERREPGCKALSRMKWHCCLHYVQPTFPKAVTDIGTNRVKIHRWLLPKYSETTVWQSKQQNKGTEAKLDKQHNLLHCQRWKAQTNNLILDLKSDLWLSCGKPGENGRKLQAVTPKWTTLTLSPVAYFHLPLVVRVTCQYIFSKLILTLF